MSDVGRTGSRAPEDAPVRRAHDDVPEDTVPYVPARNAVTAPPRDATADTTETVGTADARETTATTERTGTGETTGTTETTDTTGTTQPSADAVERAEHDAPEPTRATPSRHRHRRRRRRLAVVATGLLVVALGAATVYLYRTTTAWEDRAGAYLADAHELGGEVATARAELAGTEAELAAVRDQLAAAHGRIVELADEKAQLGDDREVQRQLADYQERVSTAAGQVAHALDQCVQGQQQLIGYLQQTVEGSAQYDPEELTRFTADVETLCQAASEANMSLQRELSR